MSEFIGLRAMTPEQVTTTVLESMTCRDVTIMPTGSHWHIDVRAGLDTPLPLLVAMLQSTLPADLETLVLTAHRDDGTHVLAGPIAPWNQLALTPQDTDAHPVAFLRAQLSWTYDGAPWLPTALVRSWVANQAASTLQAAPAAAVSRLRTLRELAVLAADDTLIWALAGTIRFIRLGPDSDTAAELTQLQAWCGTPAPEPSWWQGYQSAIH